MRDSPPAQRQNADVMGGLAAHERGPTAASEATRLLPSAAAVASLPQPSFSPTNDPIRVRHQRPDVRFQHPQPLTACAALTTIARPNNDQQEPRRLAPWPGSINKTTPLLTPRSKAPLHALAIGAEPDKASV
ncbi:hypothetical protein MRS44_007625 [Fusarium solani]|uniref:uncharacterized protein n=1 Tax=Fusarium solani TaxID=169388 RepID=UPI0032C45D93|nr:hypothetical protein MRS44_007625 [Fusarium solani]